MRPLDVLLLLSGASGTRVLFKPDLLPGTRTIYRAWLGAGEVLVVWSSAVLAQMLEGVVWHDDADHCRTWTEGGGCRCDIEERR